MDITIGGPQPLKPEESHGKENVPQWHPIASGTNVPGISKDNALQDAKRVLDTQNVEPHVALYYLATSDWVEPLFKELEQRSKEVQERCCQFLEGFGVDSKTLKSLVQTKNYEALKNVLPKGEEIALRLLGRDS